MGCGLSWKFLNFQKQIKIKMISSFLTLIMDWVLLIVSCKKGIFLLCSFISLKISSPSKGGRSLSKVSRVKFEESFTVLSRILPRSGTWIWPRNESREKGGADDDVDSGESIFLFSSLHLRTLTFVWWVVVLAKDVFSTLTYGVFR